MFQGIFMATQFTQAEAARFLRTLRVTTQTALAQYDLQKGRAAGRPVVTFQALAAKGAGEWRFPGAGLMSADGLRRKRRQVSLQIDVYGVSSSRASSDTAA